MQIWAEISDTICQNKSFLFYIVYVRYCGHRNEKAE
jgi:hypothetical protein